MMHNFSLAWSALVRLQEHKVSTGEKTDDRVSPQTIRVFGALFCLIAVHHTSGFGRGSGFSIRISDRL
jgi:hypothetical protein